MHQIMSLWQSFTPVKRAVVVLATVAMFAAVYGVANLATRPSMALLYAGLDEARAGEVLAALDQRGVVYEVRGQSIYVMQAGRDGLRMELAAQGLPANSGAGYELLDGLSGFGTTSQMFDAAYWRAKEGELSRTIAALPNVRAARVHIANVEQMGFRAPAEPTASVTVTTRNGGVSQAEARALRFLVSAAVAGMKPADVAVIDSQVGLVAADGPGGTAGNERAAELRTNVLRLLEPRVGAGKAVVEVAVETVTDSESISERRLDPQGRVAISSENEENATSASDSGKSAVTVASNLPTGAAKGQGAGSQSSDSRTSERVNYEVSETRRDLVRSPGAIRRLSVAVLVDDAAVTDASGAVKAEPRPEAELAALRDLVAAAVGFDEKRGDIITIKSLPFQPPMPPEEGPKGSFLSGTGADLMSLAQVGVLALVALVLGLFVVRPILTPRSAQPVALPRPVPRTDAPVLTGVIDDGDLPASGMQIIGGMRGAPASPAAEIDDPVARLRRLISERQDESVEVLRNWIDDPQAEQA